MSEPEKLQHLAERWCGTGKAGQWPGREGRYLRGGGGLGFREGARCPVEYGEDRNCGWLWSHEGLWGLLGEALGSGQVC